jgi:hypothetical protein
VTNRGEQKPPWPAARAAQTHARMDETQRDFFLQDHEEEGNSPEAVLEHGRWRFGLATARMQVRRRWLGLGKIHREKPLFIGDLIPNHSQLGHQSIYLEDSFKLWRNRSESDGKIPMRMNMVRIRVSA